LLGATITTYCYDGYQVIAEYDGSNNLLRKFIYGPGIDEPICMIDVAGGDLIYYYHFDSLGSVIALSNVNGEIVERYSYDVFGELNRPTHTGRPLGSDGFISKLEKKLGCRLRPLPVGRPKRQKGRQK
jgi:hypothetical protein